MRSSDDRLVGLLPGIGVLGSVAAHVLVLFGLGRVEPAATQALGPSTVSIEVSALSPPPPTPPPLPEPEPLPEYKEKVTLPPPSTVDTPPAEPIEDVSVQPEPVDLAGITLTNEGSGAGWATVTGNGRELQGPVRIPSKRATSTAVVPGNSQPEQARTAGVAQPKPTLSTIPLANLSRRPVPPSLNGKLRRNYPADARRQGLSGSAVVTARIDADGRVRVASVVSESAPGFGAACHKTVLGSAWSAPLDRSGRPVATRIAYTCQFHVDG